ncbi:MAG: copper chaperone PCu(A)C [Planktomarina sp.]
MKRSTFLIAGAVVVAGAVGGAAIMSMMRHDMDHGQMNMTTADASVGDLTLTGGFAFATLPNQPVGAGFVSVTNNGSGADNLIAATSPLAGRIEIHTMEMEDGVMKMREVAGGLDIPAGATAEMKPGGYHMMFMDLVGPIVAGKMASVTLMFENAGDVTMMLPINKRTGGGGHSGHGDH